MGLFARLSGRIGAQAFETEPINNRASVTPAATLDELARVAQQTSNAGGAAVAVVEDGVLVCRARHGSLAPPIGATLNETSGITGACVQTRQVLQCNDSSSDDRVDRAVCQAVGIRSIVVVPVIADGYLVGLVEVFSYEANAFNAKHVDALTRLAVEVCSLTPARRDVRVAAPHAHPEEESSAGCLGSAPHQGRTRSTPATGMGSAAAFDDFLEVLRNSPPSATWDDLSHELARRMRMT